MKKSTKSYTLRGVSTSQRHLRTQSTLLLTLAALISYASAQRCGTGTNWIAANSQCEACPAGVACTYDSVNFQYTTSVCTIPQYSLIGMDTCENCPAGFNCPGVGDVPVMVSYGYYSADGDHSYTQRQSGRAASLEAEFTCTPGDEYAYLSTNTADTEDNEKMKGRCLNCPQGYECPINSDKNKCLAGQYDNSGSCQSCVEGQYCPDGVNWFTCPDGTYSNNGEASCTICPAGEQCSAKTLSGKGSCGTGEYSLEGQGTCSTCQAGFFCVNKDEPQQPCAPGTYSSGGATTCIECTAGQKCTGSTDAGSVSVQSCDPGFYSENGWSECITCPPGYECQGGNQDKVQCTGYDYSEAGGSACLSASDGFYLANGFTSEAAPPACQEHSYGGDSQTSGECELCPAGYSCPPTGADNLYYVANPCSYNVDCPAGSTSPGATCADYQDCRDTSTRETCVNGEYLVNTGSGYRCDPVPANQISIHRGSLSSVTTGTLQNYYSPTGVNIEFLCPAGKDCTDPDNLLDCQPGFYSEEGETGCNECPNTHACPSTTLPIEAQIDCTYVRGYYQDDTGQTTCKVCEPGYACPYGVVSREQCTAGSYAIGAQEFCTECPPAYECPSTTEPNMFYCRTGSYSLGRQNACTVCSEGYECVGQVSQPCEADMWSSRGDGMCKYLEAGQSKATAPAYDGSGIYINNECDAGQFSVRGDATCLDCPVGYKCDVKVKGPTACTPGTYQPSTKQINCLTCPDGTWSMYAHAECYPLPVGYTNVFTTTQTFVPARIPRKCGTGTYSPGSTANGAAQTACQICDDGYICKDGSGVQNPADSLCPRGSQCRANAAGDAVEILACIKGYVGANRGQVGTFNNYQHDFCGAVCQPGYYAPPGSTEEHLCPPGHYCIGQEGWPEPCPAGSYNPNWGETSSSCTQCPQGYYCAAGSTQPVICPAGHFCGDPLDLDGTSDIDMEANVCPGGTYTGSEAVRGASTECRACWAGHYCPEGTPFPQPCPAGTYTLATNLELESQCTNCDDNVFCPFLGNRLGNELGFPCEPGHACAAGTATPYASPCPPGYHSDSLFLTTADSSTCSDCPAGFACEGGTNSFTKPMVPCAKGYYCPLNTETPTANACPAGTYSWRTDLTSSGDCFNCPAGSYCSGGLTEPDGLCDPGYYCEANSVTATENECPAGTYSSASGLTTAAECLPCPMGSYCNNNANSLAAVPPTTVGLTGTNLCPAGTYNPFTNVAFESEFTATTEGSTSFCLACPAGNECPNAGTIVPTACGTGSYSEDGATSCITCDDGHICKFTATAKTDMYPCPAGYSCYGHTGITYEPQHIDSTFSCPPGYYCADGTVAPVACAAGLYQPVYGAVDASACLVVPRGYYSNVDGTSDFYPNKCLAGHFCPENTSNPRAEICPYGFFRSTLGAEDQSQCGACPSGFFCPQQTEEPYICPLGYYCPKDTEIPHPCPIGTFAPGLGLTRVEECVSCYGGRYCQQYGLEDVEAKCDEGFYCVDKSMTPVPFVIWIGEIGNKCEAGGYCEEGSKFPHPCPPGTFSSAISQVSKASCGPCTAGSYCDASPDATRTDLDQRMLDIELHLQIPSAQPTGLCTAGYYCPDPTIANVIVDTLVVGADHPKHTAALPGYYIPADGSTGTVGSDYFECGYTYWNSKIAQTECSLCPEGYYCDELTLTYPKDCPTGQHCVEGTQNPSDCLAGTYRHLLWGRDANDCYACQEGKYCATNGLDSYTNVCDAGHWCNQGATRQDPPETTSNDYGECPYYHSCEADSGYGMVCLPGTNNNKFSTEVATDCTPVADGKYSNTVVGYGSTVTMTVEDCDPGYYCDTQRKQGSNKDYACEPGYYCEGGNTAMVPCASGEFTFNYQARECYVCPPGYFCPDNSHTWIDTTDADTWRVSITDFMADNKCPTGHYCLEGQNSGTTNPCPAGTYNPNLGAQAIDECMPAPPGYYIDQTGQDSFSLQCDGGHYCKMGSFVSNPTCSTNTASSFIIDGVNGCDIGGECRAGYYCPQGTPIEIECTPGKQCTTTGLATPDEDCPIGYYCPRGTVDATADANLNCPAGFYCPTGSAMPIACPAGRWSNQANRGHIDDCELCDNGYFCPDIAQTTDPLSTTNRCDPGFTCPEESIHSRVNICPKGYRCPQSNPDYTNDPVTDNSLANNSDRKCDHTGSPAQYQDQYGSISCKNCPAGFTCDDESKAKCKPQDYQISFYCPVNEAFASRCQKGEYTYQDGAADASVCRTCPPGYYCPYEEIYTDISFNDPLNIPYDTANPKIVDCPAGYFCPVGSYSIIDATGGDDGSFTYFICPKGYYCPSGSQIPMPCPPGKYNDQFGQDACNSQCEATYTCNYLTDINTAVTLFNNAFAQNSYVTLTVTASDMWQYCINQDTNGDTECVSGAQDGQQTLCIAGHYCPAGSSQPRPCPIGTYLESADAPISASTECTKCLPGDYCPSAGQTAPGSDCAPGYYCVEEESDKYAYPCPAGNYCPAGTDAAIECPPTEYQPNVISSRCDTCPAGWYCPDNAMQVPLICPPGQYCVAGVSAGTDCPQGTFSDMEGLKSENQCQPGAHGKYYSSTGNTSPNAGVECDAGYKCYAALHDDNAAVTPLYITGSQAGAECVSGEICQAGTSVPAACPPGTYKLTDDSTVYDCEPCPANNICPSFGLFISTITICPAGYVCIGGAIHPSNRDGVTIRFCSAGKYCDMATTGQAEIDCPTGTYQKLEGQTSCLPCPPGFMCEGLGIIDPEPCARGRYCDGGGTTQDCPAGTYNKDLYAKSLEYCHDCPPGAYCEGATFDANGDQLTYGNEKFTGLCDPGYVCAGGDSTPTPTGTFVFTSYVSGECPAGYYCPIGSSFPYPCEAGSYQPQTGQSVCLDCPEGSYCGDTGLATTSGPCDPGYYCRINSVYAQPNDYVMGNQCAEGNYCQNGFQFPCPGGSYAPVIGLAECYTCPPGYFCNDPDGTEEPEKCPPFNYCPAGSTDPTVCPTGYYTNGDMEYLEEVEQCAACPTGYYCEDGRFDRQKTCDPGYYCYSAATIPNDAANICPGGYYCEEGTKLPTACAEGEYSNDGATSADDCMECIAGKYCSIGIGLNAMYDCPVGHYCPAGQLTPKPCPKGTFQPETLKTEEDDCLDCPPGTACDSFGIDKFEDHLCDPGHYCPEGKVSQYKCPPGSYRSTVGGIYGEPRPYRDKSAESHCHTCPTGFYCPKQGTVIPEICPPGKYCLQGSTTVRNCPPGSYCPSGSGNYTLCPPGYYCPGYSDEFYKCRFGTYCPEGSPTEIPCPPGMYGSGNIDNFSIESACLSCGRGLYSTLAVPNKCFDCTPGYVCKGATSSDKPRSLAVDNGYPCPQGHYCPLGSYEEKKCPVGTYAKYLATESEDNCILCKVGWYNDNEGAAGCRKCGPTSTSSGGAVTCQCIGKFRSFIKSLGGCLCEKGYKPKDGKPNIDSVEDCEADVVEVCNDDQEVNQLGQCVDIDDTEVCQIHCPDGDGTLIPGTGTCKCGTIFDTEEVCDGKCQETRIQAGLQKNGILRVKNPVTGEEKVVDPTTVPGYYGNYQTIYDDSNTLFLDVDNDFSFGFDTNQDILDAVGFEQSADKTQNIQKLFVQFLKSPWDYRNNTRKSGNYRRLQSSGEDPITSQRLYNPVICIQEGDSIFFNVNAEEKQYPRYFKDSILNQNTNFDFGPFKKLEDMILNQNITVETFSYVFKDPGIFVFDNAASGTVTIIAVVRKSQQCTNAVNGVSAAMPTEESLAEIGVKAYNKEIDPNWYFIIGSFVIINLFVYLIIFMFITSHNLQVQQTSLANKDKQSRTLYHDKIAEMEEKEIESRFNNCIKKCRKQNKVDEDKEKEEEEEVIPKSHDFAVSYKDMEDILKEFNESQEILRQQLKDREKKKQQDQEKSIQDGLDEENEASKEPIRQLISELGELLSFITENKECVDTVLEEEMKIQAGIQEEDQKLAEEGKEGEADETAGMSQIRRATTTIIKKQIEKEDEYDQKLLNDINEQQENAFTAEIEKNEDMKKNMLEEYKNRMKNSNLSEEEKASMLAELNAKMTNINGELDKEQANQQAALNEALARRKAKKNALRQAMNKLTDKKEIEDEHYHNALSNIQAQYEAEKEKINKEPDTEYKDQLDELEYNKKVEREKLLAPHEKVINDYRKNDLTGDTEFEFAQKLSDYTKIVKEIDQKMVQYEQDQKDKIEKARQARREQKLKDAEERRKQQEHDLNQATSHTRAHLQDDMNQIQDLLKPVKDEEARLESIAGDLIKGTDAINRDTDKLDLTNNQSAEAQQAKNELKSDEHTTEVNDTLEKIKKENNAKKLQVEAQREALKKNILEADSDADKQKLLAQLDQFEDVLQAQYKADADAQNQKLQAALAKRRARKKQLQGVVTDDKQQMVLDEFKRRAGNAVNEDLDTNKTLDLATRIQTKFDGGEQVQVGENYLDKKGKQELIDLMNSLFQERADALRKFMYELMMAKQRDLDDLRDEYEPQRALLNERKAQKLISDEDYRKKMEELKQEEHDKKMDIEIEYAEKEKSLKDELEKARIEAEAEQKKLLKDRQTQEKTIMFQEMMKNMDDGKEMRNYLEKQVQDSKQELESFKKKAEKEKQAKIDEMERENEAKLKELQDRQERMFDWEATVKKDQAKLVDQLKKQKEDVMSKKLAEQQKEILRDMNKKDVDALLERHKKQLTSMEEALAKEQERQMARMKEKLKGRNKDNAKDKMMKQIKMAEIQKQREKELADAKAAAIDPSEFEEAFVEEKNNPKIEVIMQRLDNNSKMSLKPCYSRPVYYARHLKNMYRLNDFLGRNLLKSNKIGDQDSQFSDDRSISVAPDFFDRYQKGNLTYKMLLDHIEIAESNYESTRNEQVKSKKTKGASDFGDELQRINSGFTALRSTSRFQ